MPKTYDYYISKGFDSKAANYFASGRKKPIKVEPKKNFTLTITFDNLEIKTLDVKKYIKDGTVYAPLKNINFFYSCYIDSNSSICWDKDKNIDSNIVWDNKIDIGADTCYMESE